jgi:RNA polymerase sigma-70 factor (ECF subfamily)
MQKSETSKHVCHAGTRLQSCSICQPSLRHPDLADPGDLRSRAEAARPRLLRLAHMSGIGPDEAEDVVQETYLEAWRCREKLREPERFAAWLDGICRNICKRSIRATSAKPQMSELDVFEGETKDRAFDLPDPFAVDPASVLERQDLQILLDRALGHLEARTREVIELCYLAELPQREVAERLDMSLGALELKLHRARQKLHQVLHGELRDDAQALGLLRDCDESMGWQETQQWCWGCGKRRLRATFEREPGGLITFRLRCPGCSPLYGDDVVNTDQLRRVGVLRSFHRLGALRSFRPTFKYVLLAGFSFSRTVFEQRRCTICQENVQIDIIDRNTLESMYIGSHAWPQSIYLRVTCPNCEPYVCEFFTVLLMNQDVRTFLLARSHVHLTPPTMDTSAGQDAFRSRLLDLRSGERLTIMTHPQTLQTMTTVLEA